MNLIFAITSVKEDEDAREAVRGAAVQLSHAGHKLAGSMQRTLSVDEKGVTKQSKHAQAKEGIGELSWPSHQI